MADNTPGTTTDMTADEKAVCTAYRKASLAFAKENCPEKLVELAGLTDRAWQLIFFGISIGLLEGMKANDTPAKI